jgi:hypothetical protein
MLRLAPTSGALATERRPHMRNRSGDELGNDTIGALVAAPRVA